ncbi:MAG TPA: mannose-6-phosphate isomerase [Porphyromonadaceae bacterium]|jgi:mannose-6-phosphate isomerase class I|uniref:class I mannose-6-phosphate isomerase n=1 Tax=Petrimonas sp. TaxID=2023866 RepID=UPI000E91DA50|nr:class I mannose-6-phosphate isomerase [Proteiniphilum sp. UBA5218]BBD44851.1 Mannose-6-phosphate isomerase [Petrimonas sp. IBARAKI]HAC72559.1 mannose-6-phosphate isomerase [Porphyromonadaceae bacterium]HOI78460.1 class I mannose-6-phosphate isomerase [Petrimonas sp.]HBC38310.1 mannose-6-phosphate isomerase [Porphyromonadaceae bacterium]HBG79153.1 mannose-6-phosphate isomerase [Porphyromonadaceae bacterium]
MNRKRKSNYDKRPAVTIGKGFILEGWKSISSFVSGKVEHAKLLTVDCYTGVYYDLLKSKLQEINNARLIDTLEIFKSENEINALTEQFLTEDILFGFYSNLSISDYFDEEKLRFARESIEQASGTVIVFGYGAQYVTTGDINIYADMPRWEIQQRMRRKEVNGLGVNNKEETFSLQYKRGLFNDWKVLDKHKKTIYDTVDFWLDTVKVDLPKLIDKETFFKGMDKAASSPFRLVPFFDPAPWGGQWMKEVCDLDRSVSNFGWCFDCVPEENSLLLKINDIEFEMPSVNLVYTRSRELLGDPVEARFGKEFPIRFDLLDTIGGGNLSLQVHPTAEYARENFGLAYTQDESYYIMDTKEDTYVYLGLRNDINPDEMVADLNKAQKDPFFVFDVDKYVNKVPVKKHDHFLIPGGTVHCSGKDTLVLEISSTPNLFTFKLWDWQRLGLDGKPRPINVDRGKKVIVWGRDTGFTYRELVNKVKILNDTGTVREEKTGLHKNEFIETRRHIFTEKVTHYTNDSVNVLNLVEGDSVIVESLNGDFEPFVVHYAETFVVPARIKTYTVRPYGNSKGNECITIKASVRFNA